MTKDYICKFTHTDKSNKNEMRTENFVLSVATTIRRS